MSGDFAFLEQNQTCGIRLTAKLPWSPRSAFYLSLTRPRIEIDGDRRVGRWGMQFFDVPPGPHVVVVSFPYLFFPTCGRARVKVALGEGESAELEYRTPWLLFLPGDLRQVGTTGRRVTPSVPTPEEAAQSSVPNSTSHEGPAVVPCPYCGVRVAMTAGGQCPSCRRPFPTEAE